MVAPNEADDDGTSRGTKRGKVEDGTFVDAMEEQEPSDMQVPPHLRDDARDASGAADAAGGAGGDQGAALQPTPQQQQEAQLQLQQQQRQQQQQQLLQQQQAEAMAVALEARRRHEEAIAEFVARASEKGVDIADIDLATVTPAQLQGYAQQRLE